MGVSLLLPQDMNNFAKLVVAAGAGTALRVCRARSPGLVKVDTASRAPNHVDFVSCGFKNTTRGLQLIVSE